MVNAVFQGSNSAQVAAGETVTITVTKPDNSTETLTAVTQADKTYTTSKVYTIAGNYTAKAHQDADAGYSAWDSAPYPFTVTLAQRTGTLIVTLS